PGRPEGWAGPDREARHPRRLGRTPDRTSPREADRRGPRLDPAHPDRYGDARALRRSGADPRRVPVPGDVHAPHGRAARNRPRDPHRRVPETLDARTPEPRPFPGDERARGRDPRRDRREGGEEPGRDADDRGRLPQPSPDRLPAPGGPDRPVRARGAPEPPPLRP